MTRSLLSHSERWEWTTEPDRILLPADLANEDVVRVRYREHGTRTFRSFLLLLEDALTASDDLIVRAIEEHANL